MSDLRKITAFLLIDHRRVFNQNPSKRALMDHIKALQDRVDILEESIKATQKPIPDLAVDTKVLVWDRPEMKLKMHFSHFKDGQIVTFKDGKTSFTTYAVACWPHWELAE